MGYLMDSHDEKGFSFPELVATLSVVAILAALAVPGMKSVLADHRVAVVTEQLYGSIMLARSEAVKRAGSVSLCRSKQTGLCAGAGDDWASGWMVFADKNGNGILDAEDQKIKIYQMPSETISIDWNRGEFLRMDSRGQARDAGTFTLCEAVSSERAFARKITVSLTGRARVTELTACGS